MKERSSSKVRTPGGRIECTTEESVALGFRGIGLLLLHWMVRGSSAQPVIGEMCRRRGRYYACIHMFSQYHTYGTYASQSMDYRHRLKRHKGDPNDVLASFSVRRGLDLDTRFIQSEGVLS
jgi:hypothetical protein